MSDPLYSKDVLRLAAAATGAGRLDEPRLTGHAHNPACGDRVTVDLRLEGGRVAALAHETKACVLAQASASILAEALPGRTIGELRQLIPALEAMLRHGAMPGDGFAPFSALAAAASHSGRHRCVLLPVEAALCALATEESTK
jgi:nitrogen fixation protein NifU and related proteins